MEFVPRLFLWHCVLNSLEEMSWITLLILVVIPAVIARDLSRTDHNGKQKRQIDLPELFNLYGDTDSDPKTKTRAGYGIDYIDPEISSDITPLYFSNRFSNDYFDDPFEFDRGQKNILHLLKKIRLNKAVDKRYGVKDYRLKTKMNKLILKLSNALDRFNRGGENNIERKSTDGYVYIKLPVVRPDYVKKVTNDGRRKRGITDTNSLTNDDNNIETYPYISKFHAELQNNENLVGNNEKPTENTVKNNETTENNVTETVTELTTTSTTETIKEELRNGVDLSKSDTSLNETVVTNDKNGTVDEITEKTNLRELNDTIIVDNATVVITNETKNENTIANDVIQTTEGTPLLKMGDVTEIIIENTDSVTDLVNATTTEANKDDAFGEFEVKDMTRTKKRTQISKKKFKKVDDDEDKFDLTLRHSNNDDITSETEQEEKATPIPNTRRSFEGEYKISVKQLSVKINNIKKISETISDLKKSISIDTSFKMGYISANIDTLKLTLDKMNIQDATQEERNMLDEKLDLIRLTMIDLVNFFKIYYNGNDKSYEEI